MEKLNRPWYKGFEANEALNKIDEIVDWINKAGALIGVPDEGHTLIAGTMVATVERGPVICQQCELDFKKE
jgi:hypothetical protein